MAKATTNATTTTCWPSPWPSPALLVVVFALVVLCALVFLDRLGRGSREKFEAQATHVSSSPKAANYRSAGGSHFQVSNNTDGGQGREREVDAFGSRRPWQEPIDAPNDKYHVEISPEAFMTVLSRLNRYDDDSGTLTREGEEEKKKEEISVPVPEQAEFVLKQHYTRAFNAAAKEVGQRGDGAFTVTMALVHAAYRRRSGWIRWEASLCFHRPGKSVGHCVRVSAFVDRSMRRVRPIGPGTHIGVLPEHLAARR